MQSPATRRALIALFAATTLVLAACGGAPPAPTAAPKTEAPKPAAASPAPAAASPTTPAASPAAAAASPATSVSPAASPGASPSTAASSNINGEVDAVDGRTLSVVTATGVRRVRVADNASILIDGQGTGEDLKPGVFVGITGKPDGTALIVRLFRPGVTPKPSQFPMSGPQAGNIMTNASVVSFDGKTLVVDMGGEKPTITVTPETQIVKPVPSTFAEVKPGVRISAVGMPEGDILVATTVAIVTQPAPVRAN